METKVLNQMEVANMQGAIRNVLAGFRGVPVKVNYDLNRILKILDESMKKWGQIHQNIFQKYSVDSPRYKFIPITEYQKFKEEIINTVAWPETLDSEGIKEIMEKYEVEPNTDYMNCIPTEMKVMFDSEVEKTAEETFTEISFNKIPVVQDFIEGLNNLAGIHQLAIIDLFEVVAQSNIIIPEMRLAPKFPVAN